MDKRSAFVLDGQGIVRYAKVYEPGTIPESKEMLEAVKNIKCPRHKCAVIPALSRGDGLHSGCIPAALMMRPHFSVSTAWNFASSSGEARNMTSAFFAKKPFTESVASALLNE